MITTTKKLFKRLNKKKKKKSIEEKSDFILREKKNLLKLLGVCEMKLLQEFFTAPDDVGDIVHTSEMVKKKKKFKILSKIKSFKKFKL